MQDGLRIVPWQALSFIMVVCRGDVSENVCGGRDMMSRRSTLAPNRLGGRLVLALAVVAAVMALQAIVGASPALALTERPDDTYMTNGGGLRYGAL